MEKPQPSPAVLPGRTIGILGGGQLGRMFALAARQMGYRVHALDPTRDCPAGQIADHEVCAAYDDKAKVVEFAENVEVVTFEFENIPAESLEAIAELRPVRPAPSVLHICRHRLREKDFLHSHGFPVTRYRAVRDPEELRLAVSEFGTPCVLKSADFGYDGKGQVLIKDEQQINAAWQQMGRPVGVLEAFVPFSKELSVVCARTIDGDVVSYPVAENEHRRHILDVTIVPASINVMVAQQAAGLARSITRTLDVVGVLAVEMFLVGEDRLLINELAPRPHNSGHFSIDACSTSQFEQQLRAVCRLPLGDVRLHSPVAMANLLGDLWLDGEPNWAAALRYPNVKLHVYGKHEPRPGRKMGHLTALAPSPAEARQIVVEARAAL